VTRGSLVYGNSTPKWDELVIGSADTLLTSDGTDASWTANYSGHVIVFTSTDDDPADEDIVDGIPSGVNTGESGEHGDFTLIRAQAVATSGVGTNTIIIEASSNPASFASPETLFTLSLDASGQADDATPGTWTASNIYIRARWSDIGSTPPSKVRVYVFLKQKVSNF
jgi:hypothetical protein